MASAPGTLGQLRALYRAILRVHREKLPGPLRMLGDGYAADEFRRHLRGNTTAAQWAEFGKQWQTYVAALHQTQPDLVPEVVELDLNRQQQEQLHKLKQAAQDLAQGGGRSGAGDVPPGSSSA